MNLFVAVATGQNVSNLPPILQFARRGDETLWLESNMAAARGWADGAIEVLDARGIASHRAPIRGDINDPEAVRTALKEFLVANRDRHKELNLVLNGGQKLTPFGLALAARYWRDRLGRPVRFLYGDDRPSRVQVREGSVGAPMRLEAYDRARMPGLEEVLKAGGSRLVDAGKPLDLHHPIPPTAYDTDPGFVDLAHRAAALREDDGGGKCPWPGWNAWSQGSKKTFNQHMTPLLEALAGGSVSREEKKDFYARLVRILREFSPRLPTPSVSRADKRRLVEEGWWKDANTQRFGERFEEVVAGRVQRFLAGRSEIASTIREVRCNVRVPDAEWDIVLVLTNGILVVLECKSWSARKKDMDARIHVLQRASGRLARMCLVAPLFPEHADKPWFPAMHDNFEKMRGFELPMLAFTLPERNGLSPAFYVVPRRKDEFPWPEPFEHSLQRMLAPYAAG